MGGKSKSRSTSTTANQQQTTSASDISVAEGAASVVGSNNTVNVDGLDQDAYLDANYANLELFTNGLSDANSQAYNFTLDAVDDIYEQSTTNTEKFLDLSQEVVQGLSNATLSQADSFKIGSNEAKTLVTLTVIASAVYILTRS